MQRWGFGLNGYYKTSTVHLDEAPWWVFAAESVIDWVCDHIPDWHIPILKNKKVIRDGEEYTFGEYHGTICDLFCVYVHMPVSNYLYSKMKVIDVKIPWDQCKELFYHLDKDRWDEEEKTGEQMRKDYGEPTSK